MKVSGPAHLPYPGDELAFRVQGAADRKSFHASGKRSVEDFERALAAVSKTWDSFEQVLDFGCGSGRIMLWLAGRAPNTSFHGVDIDARAIRWAEENLPFATFKVNEPLPPLPYSERSFDLVFNHSVFTHIDRDYQDQWLAELHRVTRPGATLILSVHGDWAFEKFEESLREGNDDPASYRKAFDREGIVYIEDDSWLGSAFPDFYHTTFHASWYVFRHWSRFFDIKAYLPRGDLNFQDLIVLERRDEATPPSVRATAESARPPVAPARASDADNGPGRPLGGASPRQRAASLLRVGPDPASPTRFGAVGRFARQAVLRSLRNYMAYQKAVDNALLESIPDPEPGPQLTAHSILTLREVVKQQGERINRLEADVLAAIEDLRSDKRDRHR